MKRIFLALLLFGAPVFAIPVTPIVQPHVTFVNGAGLPCAGCKLSTFASGTTTPLATYTDASGVSQNTNPITLDAAGGANIWLGVSSYKFILKDSTGATIWSVDQVNAGSLFPCASPGAIQVANSSGTGLTCDPNITINTTNHTISVGVLPANHVSIGALGTPTAWTFDTTTPATALASLGGGSTNPGTINQLGFYAAAGNVLSGTSAIPAGITAITQSPNDNTAALATTAYVKLPGAINPTSVQVAAGVAMTDNQGNGVKVQHSTGATTPGNGAKFDADGNVIDAGSPYPVGTPRTCNSNGCYRIEGDGTIEQWGSAAGCGSGVAACNTAVTFPIPFTTTTNLSVTVTEQGSKNNYGAAYTGLTASGMTVQFGAFSFVGGSGTNLDGSETATWQAKGN